MFKICNNKMNWKELLTHNNLGTSSLIFSKAEPKVGTNMAQNSSKNHFGPQMSPQVPHVKHLRWSWGHAVMLQASFRGGLLNSVRPNKMVCIIQWSVPFKSMLTGFKWISNQECSQHWNASLFILMHLLIDVRFVRFFQKLSLTEV